MERGESIDQYAAKFDRACNRLRMRGIARLHQFIANILPEFRSSLVANPVATYEDALARCRTISDNTECIKADDQVLRKLRISNSLTTIKTIRPRLMLWSSQQPNNNLIKDRSIRILGTSNSDNKMAMLIIRTDRTTPRILLVRKGRWAKTP